ncbi:hypothetical protein N7494_005799 [Penicillium frequentans]|uniref:Uncharacterized protein n=1 Tax=Penicillium frequentans TaxID=3151616 RepID=A0AAD6GFE7_9EURO|nr:hypothetical protein N7494_005799 [Penicillium glabrum]
MLKKILDNFARPCPYVPLVGIVATHFWAAEVFYAWFVRGNRLQHSPDKLSKPHMLVSVL